MSTISVPVAPPPASPARSTQETETQKAVAKPQARESRSAEDKVKIQPAERAERFNPVGPEASARLTIDFDKESGRYIYRLVDPVTREVLREIPSEDALRRIRSLREAAGLKVDKQL